MKNWEEVQEILEDEGVWIKSVREEYGGRGCFGSKTTGFILDKENYKHACDILNENKIYFDGDSMGLDYIIY